MRTSLQKRSGYHTAFTLQIHHICFSPNSPTMASDNSHTHLLTPKGGKALLT